MQKLSSKLDWTQMLGFEQIVEQRPVVRDGAGKLNSKVGGKLGGKLGGKTGFKLGLKIGTKEGSKK